MGPIEGKLTTYHFLAETLLRKIRKKVFVVCQKNVVAVSLAQSQKLGWLSDKFFSMASQQQSEAPQGPQPGFPYPTPVPNARSRFVELLNKHGLPINTFINDEMEIGVNDLTNLHPARFVELCKFFNLNTVQQIRFEKLVNELYSGEEQFSPLNAKSIDTYNHNKTIATSHNESLIIQALDDEYQKIQCISQLAEFMIIRTNDKCSKCQESINKIFESQKESIVQILEHRKQELKENIKQFQELQIMHIQSYVEDIDEYQANIKEVCCCYLCTCLLLYCFNTDMNTYTYFRKM